MGEDMPNDNYRLTARISDDYYKAYFSIEFDEGDYTVGPEEVKELLKQKNIVFGINESLLASICSEKRNVIDELIAEGIPHEHGLDAEVEYKQDVDAKIKPQVLDDGRVDFKNIGFVKMVKKGDILAEKKPATAGTIGTTVTGKNLRGKNGKDKRLKTGKNVTLSKDGLKVIAEIDGSLDVESDKISVLNLLEINSDIGIETGNINFKGQVIIHGNVTDGHRVVCDEDLVINGVVEGAYLEAGGSITISRGIQGHNQAEIICGKNLVVNFINSAKVKTGGFIESGAIMNSIVKADGDIIVKSKKGVIVGGEVISKRNIEATTVGSHLGVTTVVKLGVDIDIIDELKALTLEVKESMDMHSKLEKSLKLLKVKLEAHPSDEKTKQMYVKYSKNFVLIDEELSKKRERLKIINELVNNVKGSFLKSGTIYPGTRVKIGNQNYYVKKELIRVAIKKIDGDIVATTI